MFDWEFLNTSTIKNIQQDNVVYAIGFPINNDPANLEVHYMRYDKKKWWHRGKWWIDGIKFFTKKEMLKQAQMYSHIIQPERLNEETSKEDAKV